MAATCPECENRIDVDEDDIEAGETVTCDECGTELEVVSTEPLQLALVDADGYDDEDDSYRHSGDDEEE